MNEEYFDVEIHRTVREKLKKQGMEDIDSNLFGEIVRRILKESRLNAQEELFNDGDYRVGIGEEELEFYEKEGTEWQRIIPQSVPDYVKQHVSKEVL